MARPEAALSGEEDGGKGSVSRPCRISCRVILHSHSVKLCNILGDPEVSANLYCNSRTSVLWRLRDYLRLLMGRRVRGYISRILNRILTGIYIQHTYMIDVFFILL